MIHLHITFPSTFSKWFLSLKFPHHNPVIVFDLITRITYGEEYTSLSSSLCSFLHSPVTSSLLGPNILLSTLFSHTLSLRSSLNVRDQVFTQIIYIYIYMCVCVCVCVCVYIYMGNARTHIPIYKHVT